MKKISPVLCACALILTLALLAVAGCGEKGAQISSDDNKAFDSAPAEVKTTWEKALAADKANDYSNALQLFADLDKMILSEPQRKALQTESTAFNQRLWQAAEKNDAAAVKTVQEANKSRKPR